MKLDICTDDRIRDARHAKRRHVEWLLTLGESEAIRHLDRECDQRGEQESGYGPGQYWMFYHVCYVRLDGAGFRVHDDSDSNESEVTQ